MSVVTTGEAEQRHSLRNGFVGCFELSPVSMTLLVTVARDIIDITHLAPAQGCQDHTTWPPAARIDREALRSARCDSGHRIPPRVS
jgi:hypothetical protein